MTLDYLLGVKEYTVNSCNCVTKHIPLPTKYLVINYNSTVICPTSYDNVINLLDKYKEIDGVPPGSIRKHYSKFVQNIASNIWNSV